MRSAQKQNGTRLITRVRLRGWRDDTIDMLSGWDWESTQMIPDQGAGALVRLGGPESLDKENATSCDDPRKRPATERWSALICSLVGCAAAQVARWFVDGCMLGYLVAGRWRWKGIAVSWRTIGKEKAQEI